MQDPIFKPNQWVRYELDETTGGFGKIVGATHGTDGWNYFVTGPATNSNKTSITEESVKYVLENGNWTAPQHFGGSNSAYAANAS